MTWRERTLVAILLLVARVVEPAFASELKTLATHISVHAPRDRLSVYEALARANASRRRWLRDALERRRDGGGAFGANAEAERAS